MFRTCLIIGVSLCLAAVLTSGLVAQDEGSGIVFTGCPPYVQGNYCDSMFYQVVAVDLQTGQPCPRVRYFLVSGPGEINQKSGLWTFHPELEDIPSRHRDEVEIAAYRGPDTTTADENCVFQVRVYDHRPVVESYCGAHLTVLPGQSITVPFSISDDDPCHQPEITGITISPELAGLFQIDPESGEILLAPIEADRGRTFTVTIRATSGPALTGCTFYVDVFEPEPFKLRIANLHDEIIQIGDTVGIDLTVDACPDYVDWIDLLMRFDTQDLEYLGASKGAPFFDPDTGCGWESLNCFETSPCYGGPVGMLNLRAAAGGGLVPSTLNCLKPSEFPAVLATLWFVVRGAATSSDHYSQVDFYWCDCHDNQLWSPAHGELYAASEVRAAFGWRLPPSEIPGPAGTGDDCFYFGLGTKERTRRVEYRNGGMQLTIPAPGPQAPYRVSLGYKQDQIQGQFVDIPILLEATDEDKGLGGFDFLIAYDNNALAFQLAYEGQLYEECGWEYFTYRFSPYGDCGATCPSGLLRVVGMAETNNGDFHPGCDSPYPGYVQPNQLAITLAQLRFLVSNDLTLGGQFVPLRFYWYDCKDNMMANHDGSVAFISARVFDYGDQDITGDGTQAMPTYQGSPIECLADPIPRPTRRFVDYYNGGVQIIGYPPFEPRGDINLNGLAYEIADAVMFTNYFTQGLAAFGNHVEASIAASDCNADGEPLTIEDLVYLIRVVIGDAQPYAGGEPSPNVLTLEVDDYYDRISLFAPTPDSLGALHIRVKGEVTPIWHVDQMEMKYGHDSGYTNILIYSTDANEYLHVYGPLLTVPGFEGIVEARASTFRGQRLPVVSGEPTDVEDTDGILPSQFALHANYPNPFNPSTTIAYDLPRAASVEIVVYNIMGQRVRTVLDEPVGPGSHTVEWNGRDEGGTFVSSGIYLYRMVAGEFVQTRKMLLLK